MIKSRISAACANVYADTDNFVTAGDAAYILQKALIGAYELPKDR